MYIYQRVVTCYGRFQPSAWALVPPLGSNARQQALVGFAPNGQQHATLAATGTYVIQVARSNFVATGNYNLSLP